jgi:Fe2+ transport system protein FeoA
MGPSFPLASANRHEPLVLLTPPGDGPWRRRLAELGLRDGSSVSVIGATAGGGRIIGVDGARIAVDRDTSTRLLVRRAS